MPSAISDYGADVQRVPVDTPVEDVIALLKRDGGVIVKGYVTPESVDQCYKEIKPKMDADREWQGKFFPKETKRCPGLIGVCPTYTRTQLRHPLYKAVCDHFLTTRSSFWWGDEWKESVSQPYVHSAVASRIGPGGKAQPLHRDDYIHHNVHTEAPAPWDDERDKDRETAIGLFVAGVKTRFENGATLFIPGSHLWGNDRKTPPDPRLAVPAELEKGDAFFMFASCFHGGGANITEDEYRLVFGTFVTRGYLRQEENQFLAVPMEVAKEYDRDTQKLMGYSLSDPACGTVELMDPIFQLYPEELANAKPGDF